MSQNPKIQKCKGKCQSITNTEDKPQNHKEQIRNTGNTQGLESKDKDWGDNTDLSSQ